MFNQTIAHAEVEVLRARTGGAYRMKNSGGAYISGLSLPAKGSMPAAIGKTGTILSTGTQVRGTSTLFKNEIYAGDFLYAKDVVRRVVSVDSNTMLTIEDAFPTDIAVAVIPMICKAQMYVAIYAKNTHASGDAIIQEAPIAAANTFLNGGSPISYDASAGRLEFQLHR